MSDKPTDHEIKMCCSTFYQSDIVRMLLGDVLHPGGLALTHRLGTLIGLDQKDRVLEIVQQASRDNQLSCCAAWRIADDLDYSRAGIATACDALGIKLIACQLGAF